MIKLTSIRGNNPIYLSPPRIISLEGYSGPWGSESSNVSGTEVKMIGGERFCVSESPQRVAELMGAWMAVWYSPWKEYKDGGEKSNAG